MRERHVQQIFVVLILKFVLPAHQNFLSKLSYTRYTMPMRHCLTVITRMQIVLHLLSPASKAAKAETLHTEVTN